ncbi:MAG: transglutaminase-like domain-containing protein, partial [Cyclobacteriaceae bacterium]|nr:transglutaminase-like domain-containing protein [Cyclobacteriaceae bacterium]
MTEKEIKAMISLLDDEDENIIAMISKKIATMGEEIIPFLETAWETSFNPLFQQRIEDLTHSVQYEQVKRRLAEWYATGSEDLLEGMWIVATYQFPELDQEKLRQDIEQIYYDTWLEFKPDLHPFDQVKILNSVFFYKLKFSGNHKNFHSPSNSFINSVLESRRGNPITLSVIYML